MQLYFANALFDYLKIVPLHNHFEWFLNVLKKNHLFQAKIFLNFVVQSSVFQKQRKRMRNVATSFDCSTKEKQTSPLIQYNFSSPHLSTQLLPSDLIARTQIQRPSRDDRRNIVDVTEGAELFTAAEDGPRRFGRRFWDGFGFFVGGCLCLFCVNPCSLIVIVWLLKMIV